jgi:hypothetical protein
MLATMHERVEQWIQESVKVDLSKWAIMAPTRTP